MPAFDPRERPDQDMIEREDHYLGELWAPGWAECKRAYSYYFRTNDIWAELKKVNPRLAANRPSYHGGRATSLIDHMVASQLAFSPRFTRLPTSDTEEHKDRANRVEKGLAAVYEDAVRQNQYYTTKVNALQLAICNYTQLFTGLSTEDLALGDLDEDTGRIGRPKQRRGESQDDFEEREWDWMATRFTWNPIRLEAPQLGNVLMDPTTKNPRIAIEHRTYKAYELDNILSMKAKLGKGENLFTMRGDPYEDIEVIIRWSSRWVGIMEKGKRVVFVERNEWGFQPFTHTFGGATDMPIGEEWNPVWYVRQGLLFPVMETLTFDNQRVVATHQILIRQSFARLGYDGDPIEAAKQLLGEILKGKKDQWWIEMTPQLPGGNFAEGEELRRDIEEATQSLGEAGFQVAGVDTATQAIINSERSSRKAIATVAQMEHIYSMATANVMKLTWRMNSVMGIKLIDMGEHSLRASDLKDKSGNPRFHIETTFENVDAVKFLQEKQDARQEIPLGLQSKEGYHVIARHSDPTTINRQVLEDQVRDMPLVHAELERNVMRKLGLSDLADRLEAEAKVAERASQLVGPDGVTPIRSGQPPAPVGAGAA